MKKILTVFILIILDACNIAFASPISGAVSYEYYKKAEQAQQLTPDITLNLHSDLNKHLSFNGTFESNRTNDQPAANTVNTTFLEYTSTNHDYIIGKQSYTLSNGLIASMSGINGIYANVATQTHTAAVFYGGNNKNILAAELALNKLANHENLTLEANFFQDNNRYTGIAISGKLTDATSLTVETAKNINTAAFGYLITLECGNTQKIGDTDISISYRNINPEAVSEYCVDSNYDNSKGFRIGLNSKIGRKIILTAYHDIAESQSKTNIDTTYIAISNNF